jgi:hypothetical protein
MVKWISSLITGLVLSGQLLAAEEIVDHNKMLMDHGGGHLMDMGGGMVMGQNKDLLPGGCDKISTSKEITVRAGHKYAEPFPGRMFAFDVQEYQFEPCTKLTVTLINEDSVRHQWMMHNLPKYIYPKGMFHLEVTGPGKISGTLILPPGDKTYLVHCDIAQHMEKGMKAQLKVGKGSGDLPSIPGVTPYVITDSYITDAPVAEAVAITDKSVIGEAKKDDSVIADDSIISGIMVIGLALGLLLAPYLAKKFKGMSAGEIAAYLFDLINKLIAYIMKIVGASIKFVSEKIK